MFSIHCVKAMFVLGMLLISARTALIAQGRDKAELPAPVPSVVRPSAAKPNSVPSLSEYPFAEMLQQLELEPRRSMGRGSAGFLAEGTSPAHLQSEALPAEDLVPEDFLAEPQVPLGEDAHLAIQVDQSWKGQSALPSPGSDGRVVYTYGTGLPTVICAPLRLCVIELEPGEKLVGEPHIGDSVRWLIEPASSGAGMVESALLVVKPKVAGLDTNLILTTDRRLYYLRLVSTAHEYIARTSFEYPAAETARWQAHLRQQQRRARDAAAQSHLAPLRTIEDLYFDYRVAGKHRELQPVRIFDDGEKTYIQVRDEVRHRELPVLVVVGDKGPEMVNYRVKGTLFIVDRLFEHAALILGAGKKAKRLDIVRGTHQGKVKGDALAAVLEEQSEETR
jgi:type IV secretion system protein TrbG